MGTNSQHPVEHKKPGRKPVGMQFDFKVEFVPVPEDREAAYRVGIKFLLQLLHEVRDELEQEARSQN